MPCPVKLGSRWLTPKCSPTLPNFSFQHCELKALCKARDMIPAAACNPRLCRPARACNSFTSWPCLANAQEFINWILELLRARQARPACDSNLKDLVHCHLKEISHTQRCCFITSHRAVLLSNIPNSMSLQPAKSTCHAGCLQRSSIGSPAAIASKHVSALRPWPEDTTHCWRTARAPHAWRNKARSVAQ